MASVGAAGAFLLDTTQWDNGVHTIAWSVTDDCGRSDGIGSRFFSIFNSGTTGTVQEKSSQTMNFGRYDSADFIEEIPINFDTVRVRKGYSEYTEPEAVNPDPYGRVEIEIREVERVEFILGSRILVGYTQIEDQLRPLPIGSSLDSENGIFYWQPGPGFIGEYDLVFIREDEYGMQRRIQVRVNIRPKFDMNSIRLFKNAKAKGAAEDPSANKL